MALEFHKLPEEIEQMDAYWFNRLQIWMEGKKDSEDIK
jgi:hypothetical protein